MWAAVGIIARALNGTAEPRLGYAPAPPVPCAPPSSPLQLSAGGVTHLCIERAGFVGLVVLPVLEVPLLVSLPGSFSPEGPYSSFAVSMHLAASSRQAFASPPLVVPTHALIVSVYRGLVVGLDFEAAGCAACGGEGSAACAPAAQPGGPPSCGVDARAACAPPATCDLSLIVVFRGTDAQGRPLLSFARRPSLLSRFSVAGVGEALRRLVARGE
jgi:hypothetical protein